MSDPHTVTIGRETPDQPDVRAMLAAADAYMSALYPPESNHFLSIDDLLAPNVRFLLARRAGLALGCGAVVLGSDGGAEIKRMWVQPAARGLGIGRLILEHLERIARLERIRVLRLETGTTQAEALGLYRRSGFRETPAFGSYRPDPLSVFMEKRLT